MIGRTNATNLPSDNIGIEYLTSVLCNNDVTVSSNKDLKLCLPNATGFGNSFVNSRFKSIEITGLSRITSLYNTFGSNPYLQTIILGEDLSNCTSGGSYTNAFNGLPALENVTLPAGCVKASLSFSSSPLITRASLTNILASLYDFRGNGNTATTQTLTLHATTKLMLTTAEAAAATAKGWTIA